jgi:hypothetical protein
MDNLSRRNFLQASAACAAYGVSPALLPAAFSTTALQGSSKEEVQFLTDGLLLTPLDYAQLLVELIKAGGSKGDRYLSGGAVEELETKIESLASPPGFYPFLT